CRPRFGHGRQQLADIGRGGRVDPGQRSRSQALRPEAAGALRQLCEPRGSAAHHGNRPDRGDPRRAASCGTQAGGPGLDRAQRGVRGAVAGCHRYAWPRCQQGQSHGRRDRARPSAGRHWRYPVGDSGARPAAQESQVRHGHHVRRHGAGRGGNIRKNLTGGQAHRGGIVLRRGKQDMKPETIQAADGMKLSARVYEPDRTGLGSVVIGGAMGVRQDYYAPFAQWLAGRGWRVFTFDYRGSGESGPSGSALRGFKADLFDWTRDYEAVIDHAHAALPGRPLFLLGHSLGAQLPGLLSNQDKVSGMLSVAAGSGYWRENAPQLKRVVFYFWFVLVPLATRLC